MNFNISNVSSKALLASAPTLFVILWSTGFVGAKMGLPYAEPFTFLAIRMTIAAALTGLIAVIFRAQWPTCATQWGWAIIVGLLLQGTYLGGVFFSISRGMPAAVCALIVCMQPILTAILVGPLLGENISGRQWLGLGLGLTGVVIVLFPGIAPASIDGIGIASSTFSLFGITLGTLLQKRNLPQIDFRSGGTIQFSVASIFFIVLAVSMESGSIIWSSKFIFALSWLVLIMSLGAISLMFILIRMGSATSFSSIFYLVPPVTALIEWGVFNEQLIPNAWIGIALAATGVWLIIKYPLRKTSL